MPLMIGSVTWKHDDKGNFNGHGDCKGKLILLTFVTCNVCKDRYSVRYIMPRSSKYTTELDNELRGLSPQANYTDRATAACRRS
jgi:hypothetical protein